MKTYLLILLAFAFLQSAFLGVNMVLVILIAKSLSVDSRDNLLLAFFAGLFLSFLTQINLGYWPLVFLLIFKLAALVKKLPVSFGMLMIFLCASLLVASVALLNKVFISQTITIWPHILETVLVVLAFYITRIWDERFIVRRSIKLKI